MKLFGKTEKKEKTELPVRISLKNNSEKELEMRRRLENVLTKYSLEKWILCREVLIEEGVRAHSHPIITLSERKTEEATLAVFLHEQIHWIENTKHDSMDAAIEELKVLFPGAPVGMPEGSTTEQSTYRHLIICRLEFLALAELLGEDKAKETVMKNKNYTWIRSATFTGSRLIDPIIEKYFPEVWSKVRF